MCQLHWKFCYTICYKATGGRDKENVLGSNLPNDAQIKRCSRYLRGHSKEATTVLAEAHEGDAEPYHWMVIGNSKRAMAPQITCIARRREREHVANNDVVLKNFELHSRSIPSWARRE